MSALREEDVVAVLDALRSGWLTMGPRIAAFEAEFAAWTGAPHAVACSSGTAALHLALLAERLPPGAPVLVPALGGHAAAEAVRHAGGQPVFADVVSPVVPVLDVVDVERRLGAGAAPAAVVVVHAFGHPADAGLLAEVCGRAGIHLLEDARGAVGAVVGAHDRQAGTFGRCGCFSFADGRLLPVGEGGMVVTADEDAAARVRLLRAHAMTSGTWDRHRGHSDSYDVVDIGFNFRLDEPRAALGSSRLRHLAADLEAHRRTARAWRAALAEVPAVRPCFGTESAAHASHGTFPLLAADAAARDAAIAALGAAGLTAWAEPALAPLPRASEAAERLVVLGLDSGVPAATLVSALRA